MWYHGLFECEVIPYPVVNGRCSNHPYTLSTLSLPALCPATSRASFNCQVQVGFLLPGPLWWWPVQGISPKVAKDPFPSRVLWRASHQSDTFDKVLRLPPLCMPPPPGPARPLQERQSSPWQGGTGAGKYPTAFDTTPRPEDPASGWALRVVLMWSRALKAPEVRQWQQAVLRAVK